MCLFVFFTQISSFTDLCSLLLELLNQSETPVSEDIIGKSDSLLQQSAVSTPIVTVATVIISANVWYSTCQHSQLIRRINFDLQSLRYSSFCYRKSDNFVQRNETPQWWETDLCGISSPVDHEGQLWTQAGAPGPPPEAGLDLLGGWVNTNQSKLQTIQKQPIRTCESQYQPIQTQSDFK